MKTPDMRLLLLSANLLMDEMFFWNREVLYAVSPRRAELRNTSLIKTRFLQNVETSMSSANIQKHNGVEPDSSHRRRLLVCGAGNIKFR